MHETRERVPGFFLIKLRSKTRYHYVFCELSMAYNYDIDPESAPEHAQHPLIDRECFDGLLARFKRENGDVQIEDIVVLPEPGDANSSYTRRMQSSSDQSIDD